ncbi:MAG: hypothetical protein KC505_00025 [Myxococcales bacterium]|nr:hypothetical protein [Myxococcales bacterium]USN51694.1 MAG: hypothetical protein H6731_04610 [Myxococcales bacterium]
MLKKTLGEFYALGICLIATIAMAISIMVGLWSGIEVAFPYFTLSGHELVCHQNDEKYADCYSDRFVYTREKDPIVFPSGKQLTNKREQSLQQALFEKQHNAKTKIAVVSIIFLVSMLSFLIHWRMRKQFIQ